MNAPRTSVVMVGLGALVAVACNAVLGIQVLDRTGTTDAGGQTAGADATTSSDAPSEGSVDGPMDAPGPSDAPVDASGPSDAGADVPSSCGLPYGTSACAACARQHCCSESNACATDPQVCAPYESCLGSCNGDPACRSRCTIDHPVPASSSAPVSALSACLASSCQNECALPCGAFAGYLSEPGAAAACQGCLNTANNGNACTDSLACGSSADCDAYWRCYRACPTPDCKFACALQHDAGAALFEPLQQDYSGSCATDCAYGNYWACVGHLSWPAAKSPTVHFTVPVIDFFPPHSPRPGQTVSICATCPCGTPVDPVVADGGTDDAGIVTLSVPNDVNSAGVGLQGCVEVTSPDTVPYFGYWGYPFSEAVVDPALGPSSAAADLAAQSAQTFTPAELNAATAYVGVVQDSARGLVGAAPFDCLANPAPGVRVTIDGTDSLVSEWYGREDAGATLPPDQYGGGFAFFYNVPPGLHVVTATPTSVDGGPSSIENIYVFAGTTVAVGMFPTPGLIPFPSH